MEAKVCLQSYAGSKKPRFLQDIAAFAIAQVDLSDEVHTVDSSECKTYCIVSISSDGL